MAPPDVARVYPPDAPARLSSGARRRTRMSHVKTTVLLALGLVSFLPLAAWADDDHTPDDASAVVKKYLDAKVKKEGVFHFKDAQADAQLDLVMEEIRVARGIHRSEEHTSEL